MHYMPLPPSWWGLAFSYTADFARIPLLKTSRAVAHLSKRQQKRRRVLRFGYKIWRCGFQSTFALTNTSASSSARICKQPI